MASSIWQSQMTEPPRVSLEFIRHQSGKLGRSMKNERNVFYIIATAACTAGLISIFKHWMPVDGNSMDVVFDTSTLLFVLGLICTVFYVRKHVATKQVDANVDALRGLMTYHAELERLIELTRREWHVLLYFFPSYLTLLIGGLIFDHRPGKTWRYGLTVAAGVVSVCVALLVGRRKRKCLQRELDAIASLK